MPSLKLPSTTSTQAGPLQVEADREFQLAHPTSIPPPRRSITKRMLR